MGDKKCVRNFLRGYRLEPDSFARGAMHRMCGASDGDINEVLKERGKPRPKSARLTARKSPRKTKRESKAVRKHTPAHRSWFQKIFGGR